MNRIWVYKYVQLEIHNPLKGRKGSPVPNYGKVEGVARIMIYPTSVKEGL